MSDETDLSSGDATTEADQAAQIEAAMAEARARLADVPAETMVVNHAMGLYELGAIHLSAESPDLVSASLAIDAMAAIVEGLGDRLGDDAQVMRDALANIRMAFVGVKAQTGQSESDDAAAHQQSHLGDEADPEGDFESDDDEEALGRSHAGDDVDPEDEFESDDEE